VGKLPTFISYIFSAVLTLWTCAFVVSIRVRRVLSVRLGAAIASSTPMITTTNMISRKVNPRGDLRGRISFTSQSSIIAGNVSGPRPGRSRLASQGSGFGRLQSRQRRVDHLQVALVVIP